MDWYVAALRQYAVFNGRARRIDYWMFSLFSGLIALDFSSALIALDFILIVGILASVYFLAMIVPTIAVTVRRLHDTGRSGWWLLVALIPIIGGLLLLVFLLQRSESRENQYGPRLAPLDGRASDEPTRIGGDVTALSVLAVAVVTASFVYFGSWSGAISFSVPETQPGVGWLRAHVLLYLTGNALLLATLGLTFAFGISGFSARVRWLESSLLLTCVFFIGGIYCGSRFAILAWGFVPSWSDPKFILSAITGLLLTFVALPLAIWMRSRMRSKQRHMTVAWLLLLLTTIAAVTFASPPSRTFHPRSSVLPLGSMR